MPRCTNLRLTVLGVLFAAISVAAGADGGQDQKLAAGKTPGTFHFVYRGTVRFTMEPAYPAVASITSNFTGTLVSTRVPDAKPFTLEADLRPGTYSIAAAPTDRGKAIYWEANPFQFFVDKNGHVWPDLALAKEVVFIHKMTGLSPADDKTAGDDQPVLKWDPVPGARLYEGGFQAGKVSGPIETQDAHFKPPKLPAGETCDWFVHAIGDQWRELAAGSASFYTHGTVPPAKSAPRRGFVGFALDPASAVAQPPTTQERGGPGASLKNVVPSIRIARVMDGSPASKAGLRAGDRIVAVDGKPVAASMDNADRGDADAFVDQISAANPGTVLILTVKRGGEERTIPVTIGPPPDPQVMARMLKAQANLTTSRAAFASAKQDAPLGIVSQGFAVTRDPNESQFINGGKGMLRRADYAMIPCIMVSEIAPDSPALEAGLRPGDWIVAVDGKPIQELTGRGLIMGDFKAFITQLRAAKPGAVITLTIRRDSKEMKIPITVGRPPTANKGSTTPP